MEYGAIKFPERVKVVRCDECIYSKKPTDKQRERHGLLNEALLCRFWKDKKGRWPFDYCSYGQCKEAVK